MKVKLEKGDIITVYVKGWYTQVEVIRKLRSGATLLESTIYGWTYTLSKDQQELTTESGKVYQVENIVIDYFSA